MSTIDSSVSIQTQTGVDGNSYTSSISNDQLTNEDFITLMLTELQLQDPTKPVDSASMLDSQLQMSTMEANLQTVEAMEALTASLGQSTLSDSANLIGRVVENGNISDSGDPKQFQVSSVYSQDGEVYLTAYEVVGYDDMYYFEPVDDASSQIPNDEAENSDITITTKDGTTHTFSTENKTYEELATEIAQVDGIGADVLETADGQSQLIIAVGGGASSLKQTGIELDYSTDQNIVYNDEIQTIKYTSINKIY